MGKHSMTDRNLFGQERPGEGQISVADAEWNARIGLPPVNGADAYRAVDRLAKAIDDSSAPFIVCSHSGGIG